MVAGRTKDQAAGTYDQVAGAVKEKTGEVIGDRELQAKGMFQKAEGHVEEGVGDAKKEFGK